MACSKAYYIPFNANIITGKFIHWRASSTLWE